MKTSTKVLYWTARVLCILAILFLSLFSLDSFSSQRTFWQNINAFLMHNIPSIIMLILLILAWKRPVVGFVAFLAAAVLFAIFFVRGIYSLPNLLLFVFPILLVAFLFYADWKWLKPQPSAQVDVTAKVKLH